MLYFFAFKMLSYRILSKKKKKKKKKKDRVHRSLPTTPLSKQHYNKTDNKTGNRCYSPWLLGCDHCLDTGEGGCVSTWQHSHIPLACAFSTPKAMPMFVFPTKQTTPIRYMPTRHFMVVTRRAVVIHVQLSFVVILTAVAVTANFKRILHAIHFTSKINLLPV